MAKKPASVPAVVPPKQNVAKAAQTLPAELSAFDTGDSGFENVTSRDLLIPRLTILQGLSPQVTRGQPEYNKDAKVGDVYDTGLEDRFENGIVFIPVYYIKSWLQWGPRSSGKGLVKIHDTDAILRETSKEIKDGKEGSRDVLPNGDYIAETAQLYGINVSADFRKSFLPMASTQLKKAKRLLTLATGEKVERGDGSQFTPPLFYRSYALTTVPESNAQGNWMGWKVERGQTVTELAPNNWKDLLADIHEFRKQLASGTVRGDVAAMEQEVAGRTSGENDPM